MKVMKEGLDSKKEELVKHYESHRDHHKPAEYIRNGIGSWFTCLLYPGMELTNNLAEQPIREHVVIRKIIGHLQIRERLTELSVHFNSSFNMETAGEECVC